jgi:hypothetical protein
MCVCMYVRTFIIFLYFVKYTLYRKISQILSIFMTCVTWAENVACMMEMRNLYNVLIVNSPGDMVR